MTTFVRSVLLALVIVLMSSVVAQHIDANTDVSLGTGLTVFGMAFGAWAAVLGWVMFVIRREFSELRLFVKEESDRRRVAEDRAHEDRVHIERRLTEMEANWRNHNGTPRQGKH